MKKQDSIDLSLPQSVTARGYEIRRAPLGAYLQALKQLQDFPRDITAAMFPGQNADQVLEALKHINSDALLGLAVRALAVVPDQALALVAQLTGIPLDSLRKMQTFINRGESLTKRYNKATR